jgi:hypothetical protein
MPNVIRSGATVPGLLGAIALTSCLLGCGGGSSSATQATPPAPAQNAIPASFYGFTINKSCSISDTDALGTPCANPGHHSFPGLPFTWSRSLGTSKIRWSDLVRCDPAGRVCPIPGSGCSNDGKGTNCQLVPNCQPSSAASDDLRIVPTIGKFLISGRIRTMRTQWTGCSTHITRLTISV